MKKVPTKSISVLLCYILCFTYISCGKDVDLLSNLGIDSVENVIEDKGEDFVTRTLTFSPLEDAHLENNEGFNQNILRLEQESRSSFLLFDLSVIDGEIMDVTLQFTVDTDEGDGQINIHKGANSDWTEKELTQSNAPTADELIGSVNAIFGLGDTERISLDASHINSEKTTFILNHLGENDIAFASKENPNENGPKLLVTYNAVKGSPILEIEEEEEEEEEEGSPNSAERTYENGFFVTTSGNANNDGLTETSAWSIEHAFETAAAGDIVYIKAGNYGNKLLKVDNSGVKDKPIKFIGYTNTPEDLVSNQESTFNYGDTLNSNLMPLISGIVENGEGQGIGIVVSEDYIEIENIQITEFNRGIVASGDYSVFKNIIVTEVGDFNPSHTFPDATSNPLLNYEGRGIVLTGDGTKLYNSFVLNAGAEAIVISSGNEQIHENNKVYSDNTINPSDYYYLITNDAKNNILRNVYAERVGALEHYGHGLSLKVAASGNEFYDCKIINTKIECSFSGVTNNTFENCLVRGGSDRNGFILVANGAHRNTFKKCIVENAEGIAFMDWNDGFQDPRDINDAGNNNEFIECVVKNGKVGINFHFWDDLEGVAHNNTFTNCEFQDLENLFYLNRPNQLNKMINCKVERVNSYSASIYKNNRYTLNFEFDDQTTFKDNGFENP